MRGKAFSDITYLTQDETSPPFRKDEGLLPA